MSAMPRLTFIHQTSYRIEGPPSREKARNLWDVAQLAREAADLLVKGARPRAIAEAFPRHGAVSASCYRATSLACLGVAKERLDLSSRGLRVYSLPSYQRLGLEGRYPARRAGPLGRPAARLQEAQKGLG